MGTAVFGVISPHPPVFVEAVGGSRAHKTQLSLDALNRTALALSRFDPETLVLMSPHAPALADAFLIDDSPRLTGSLDQFGDARDRTYRGDPDLARAIAQGVASAGHAVDLRAIDDRLQPGWLDHASIVPLDFLDPNCARRLVIVSLSGLGYQAHRDVGTEIARAAESIGRRVAFIASGDLSHRLTPEAPAGYSARASDLDARIIALVEEGRFTALMDIERNLIQAGGECGLRSIIALGGFSGDEPVPSRNLAYEGPWGVGYLTALVGQAALDADDAVATPASGHKGGTPGGDESDIVRLARGAIEAHLGKGSSPFDESLDGPDYPARAGVFVSLHRGGELRGCIGTISPTQGSLAMEVTTNAIEAAVHDPRFPPLGREELTDLDIKVDILHEPEPTTKELLDPACFGVIVTSGWRRGLLLPDLEGVDEAEMQIAIALRKAGISPDEHYALQRFKVDRYT